MSSESLVVYILSSSLAVAIVSALKEFIMWRLNRKAKLSDEERENREDKIEKALKSHKESIEELAKKIETMQGQIKTTMQHDKIILRDKIKYLISKYIEYGEITLDEKQAIHHMWDIYHHGLGGNGDLDDWMDLLDELPLKEGIHI